MKLSCVVVAYNMSRELPRTAYTLTRGQKGIDPADYEVVIVDNGSREPVEAGRFVDLGVDVRVIGRVGGRVTAAVTLSLVLLLLISLGAIRFLNLH